jgi:hypothetical protein
MVANFILRHIYRKVFPLFDFFRANIESVDKVAKKHSEKIEFLTFITVCKSFRPIG